MATLKVNNKQLQLIQAALDLYTRIGIGQFNVIKEHPTFEKHLTQELVDETGNTGYNHYHRTRDAVDSLLVHPRNMLMNEPHQPRNGSWGIHNKKVDESCREAFDILQTIRHEFWKSNNERSNVSVNSHIHLCSKKLEPIEVELDK